MLTKASGLAYQMAEKAKLARQVEIGRLAHERKLPGETLSAAAARLERELTA